MKNQIVYLKSDKSVKLKNEKVYLGDVFKICGNDSLLVEKLKLVLIYDFARGNRSDTVVYKKRESKQAQNSHRVVISLLKVIEKIHKVEADVEVISLGENDIVLEYIGNKEEKVSKTVIKVIFVSLICFFGTAFTIMAFHNDINVTGLFKEIYNIFGANYPEGIGPLEIGYSIGLGVGIIVFYNHLGKRRITAEPTPLEVEMRIYEEEVYQTMIENAEREGNEVEVR